MTVQALLFDLDGTLIDSMPHHHTAWVEWHARRGLKIDADSFFVSTAGRSNDEIFRDMLPGTSAAEIAVLVDEKETLYREFAAPSLALIAGAQDFVLRAKEAGLRLAVCTASTPQNMALAFQRFGIDAWVDPSRAVPRAIITHGHADHARAGHGNVLATAETLAIMQQRFGPQPGGQALPYGERLTLGDGLTCMLLPAGHVLATEAARGEQLTLQRLADFPLITYEPGYTGRSQIDEAFSQHEDLTLNLVLSAMDADVIKTYTRLGLGVGLVAEMAVKDDPTMGQPGSELVWRPVGHLFGPNLARLAFKRGAYLRQFVLAFAELISDRLTRQLILQAMQAPPGQSAAGTGDYGL